MNSGRSRSGAWGPGRPDPPRRPARAWRALAAGTAALLLTAFRPAAAPREWEFPRDHGAHADFQTEWWYYTGHLATLDGRTFGYELTIFRRALAPPDSAFPEWRPAEFYPAHFAITDEKGRAFHHWERLRRGLGGLAGADTTRLHVWCGDWSSAGVGPRHRLVADAGEFAITLELDPHKPPVFHGEGGLSRKGPLAGQASYYYSLTRLKTDGTLRVAGRLEAVHGTSWMDHEFFSSDLDTTLVGWDWFSLQLDDDSEIMLYRLRRSGGLGSGWTSGTYVTPAGSSLSLRAQDFGIDATARWTSPATRITYPSAWSVRLPELGLDLVVRPTVPDQELDTRGTTGVIYWEGSVAVTGTRRGRPVRGVGYVELTGYDGRVPMKNPPGVTPR